MTEIPRLNAVIAALEGGGTAFATFAPAERETAVALATSAYDGVIFEMEHNPWDPAALRDGLQYLLNRGHIVRGGTLAPRPTPFVRVPPNGGELAQFHAKQALDLGCSGIVFPHISTVEEAANAVGACRYPRRPDAPRPHPPGIRGDGPTNAVRYWGLTQAEYYERADVWPLDPRGELLAILQIEDVRGVENLDAMLREVPGIGVILIGEGDLSQELGLPRQYDHPTVVAWMDRIVETCRRHGVPVGHPHVDTANVERIVAQGYRFLMTAPVRTYAALDIGRRLTGRV